MIQKIAVLSALVISTSCMYIHQSPLPIHIGFQPSYDYSYAVNDAHTGDIKSQHESRRADTVVGQYSLIQPDGMRRTVDYRADDHTGFNADVRTDGGDFGNIRRTVDYRADDHTGFKADVRTDGGHFGNVANQRAQAVSRSSFVLHVPDHRSAWM